MKFENEILQVLDKFSDVFPDVVVPPIKWNGRLTVCAGRVNSIRYRFANTIKAESIELSSVIIKDAQRLKEVLFHELAHVAEIQIYGKGGHGRTWQHCMLQLGQEPKIYHNYEVKRRKVARVEAYCDCMTHMITKQRRTKMRNGHSYRCTKCKTTLVLTKKAA